MAIGVFSSVSLKRSHFQPNGRHTLGHGPLSVIPLLGFSQPAKEMRTLQLLMSRCKTLTQILLDLLYPELLECTDMSYAAW